MKKIFLILLLFTCFGFKDKDQLQKEDVNLLMREMLEKSGEKKEMTSDLLQTSFQRFVEQADPFGLYLLEEEANSWLSLDPETLREVLAGYKENSFSHYQKLNEQLQQGIQRSRSLRQELQTDQTLFAEELPLGISGRAQDKEQLLQKHKRFFAQELQGQKEKFGTQAVLNHKDEAWKNIEKHLYHHESTYLAEEESAFVWHLLKAIAKAMDQHSTFFQKQEAQDMRVRLEKGFFGVGLILQEGIDGIYVDDILQDSPAQREGSIAKGDQLIALDGLPTRHLTFKQVMEHIRSEEKEAIELEFLREGNTKSIFLQKEELDLEENRVDLATVPFGEGLIGVLTLHSFYDNHEGVSSEKDLQKAIETLQKQGNVEGLVLDLRDNHGGFLTQAVKVAGLFITNGVIVISRYNNGEERYLRDIDGRISYSGPLVVLVSEETASAAEIVAQALQDYGLAVVVGDKRTYGKGSIQTQTVFGEPGASQFKVTVGKYYTVSGKTPEKQGVAADIVVPGHPEERGQKVSEYIETTVSLDQVPAAFDDPLVDVRQEVKPWFYRYYLPTLQQPVEQWKPWLGTLQANSAHRLKNNKNYQLFLNKEITSEEEETTEEEAVLKPKDRNSGVNDLQLEEAIFILKDMIWIEKTQTDLSS